MSIEREHNDAIQRAMASAGAPERPTDLRDWFAGQALVGMISGGWPGGDAQCARACYNLADAMLAAREGA